MKLVLATIQPTKLRAVKVALAASGVERITVSDSQEFGDAAEINMVRGTQRPARVFRKVTLQIAVNDDFLERTVETIGRVARTGRVGNDNDGQVCIIPLERTIDISNNSQGPGAV